MRQYACSGWRSPPAAQSPPRATGWRWPAISRRSLAPTARPARTRSPKSRPSSRCGSPPALHHQLAVDLAGGLHRVWTDEPVPSPPSRPPGSRSSSSSGCHWVRNCAPARTAPPPAHRQINSRRQDVEPAAASADAAGTSTGDVRWSERIRQRLGRRCVVPDRRPVHDVEVSRALSRRKRRGRASAAAASLACRSPKVPASASPTILAPVIKIQLQRAASGE